MAGGEDWRGEDQRLGMWGGINWKTLANYLSICSTAPLSSSYLSAFPVNKHTYRQTQIETNKKSGKCSWFYQNYSYAKCTFCPHKKWPVVVWEFCPKCKSLHKCRQNAPHGTTIFRQKLTQSHKRQHVFGHSCYTSESNIVWESSRHMCSRWQRFYVPDKSIFRAFFLFRNITSKKSRRESSIVVSRISAKVTHHREFTSKWTIFGDFPGGV